MAIMLSTLSYAQLTGVKTVGSGGDYATLEAAISALNTSGVGSGGVTFNVLAGHTETFSAITAGLITATGTASDPIVFQKSGVGLNPLVTAPVLSAATAYDGIIRIAGGDYITFDGIDLQENAANTTNTIDWGYAFLRASATDGAQYNEIKNCVIVLNKASTSSIGVYSASVDATGTSVTVSNATGTNSFNKVNGCNISNVYSAISFAGNSTVAYYDDSNEIGVTSGNTITNLGASSTSVRAIYGIYQKSLKVANNNISSNLNGLTTTGYGIFTNTGTSVNIDIYNNIISLSLTTGPFTSTIYGINNGAGSTASGNTVNIYGNTIQNCDLSGATSGGFQGIINSGTAATVNIYNNTINNVTLAGTGAFIGIYNSASMSTNPLNIYSNTISNNTKNGASGNMYCSQATTATINFYQNLIFNNSAAGSSTFYGYYNVGSPVSETYNNNTIHDLTHNGTGTLNAFQISTAAGVKTVSGNVIYNLTSGGNVSGYSSGYGAPTNIYKNKIYNLTSTSTGTTAGTVNGILLSGGSHVVYNNFISDLKAPACAAADAIRGIGITSVSTTTTIKLYHNTIYLNASSTGANFGTSGIFQTYSSTATTASLDMRNNIVVNKSTANGSGFTVAFRRSSATDLNNFATTSNNNNFYAGTPSATNLIYYNGTAGDQQIADYKTRVTPAETASFSENSNFVNNTSAPFDLHINPAIASRCESTGQSIAGFDTDFDGDYRFNHASYSGAGTATDIGADEFAGIPVPVCSGTPATSTVSGVSAVCDGTGTNLELSNTYTELGYTYQWKYATTTGGPYTNMGTNPIQATGNLSATTYYVCDVTCTNSSQTMTTAEKSIAINPLPTVAVNSAALNYCNPGGTVATITASGADTYTWSPSTGLSATTGASVDASPSATTTYTVTGTATLTGCINTATSTVTSIAIPINVSVTATPNVICSGSTSSLTGNYYIFNPTTVNNYTFASGTGTSLQDMTGATTNISTGDDDTPGSSVNIGFTFNFNGVGYTNCFVSPDGWLMFGGSSVGSQFTNSITSTTNIPKLYPYWDDMATGTTGYVKYLVTGSAPNRIFVAEWYVTIPRNTTGAANSTFQAWLYETSNKVEFRYGTMGSGSMTASVGLTGSATQYNSITVSTGTNSTTTANDANTGQPASGTVYTFTPPSATATSIAWTPSADLVSSSTQTVTTNALSATEQFTVTVDNSGCSTQANGTVTVSSGASITTQPTAQSECAGATATFTVAATGPSLTYQWQKGGVNIDGVGNASALTNTLTLTSIAAGDAGNYNVVVSSSCGSPVTSDIVALTVKPVPTALITTNSPICEGDYINLFGNTDIGDTYSWTGPNGYTSSIQHNTINAATLANAGSYSFTASLNGCSSTVSTSTVVVNKQPNALTVTPSSPTICNGTIQGLVASGGSIAGVSLLNETFNSGASGWTSTNTSTGGTTANADWTIHPDAYYYNYSTFHSNDNSSFYMSNSDAQGSGGTTNTTLAAPAVNSNSFTSLKLKYYHYFYNYSSAANDSAVVEVSTDNTNWLVVKKYTGSIVGTSTSFAKDSVDLSSYVNQSTLYVRFHYTTAWGYYWCIDNVSVTGDQSTTLAWAPTATLYTDASATTGYSNENIATVYAKPSSTSTYTVVATGSNSCTNSTDVTVTVNPLPTATATNAALAICNGDSTQISVTLTGTAPWDIVVTDGVTPQTITGITSSPWSVYVKPTSTTTYSVTSVTDANSCSNTSTAQTVVTVNTPPTIVVNTPSAVCSPATIDLTAAAITTGSTSGLTLSYWTDAAATASYTTASSATSGTYYIKGVDTNSCFDIEQVVATVHTSPTLSITNPAAVCSPNTIDLTAAAVTSGSTGSLTLSYWTDLAASSSYATPAAAVNGTYYIKGVDANNCYDIESVVATVNTTPTLVINTPAAVCSPNTVDITAAAITTGSTSGLTLSYWTDAGATSSYTTPATATNGTYYIKGVTAENCSDIDAVTVTVNTLPTVTLGVFADNCFADAAYGLTGGSPADGVYSGTGVNSSGVFTPSTAGVGQHTITYTYTDGNGCTNNAQRTIDVHPQPIASITAGANPVTYGFNTTLNGGASAGSGTYSYSWVPTAKIDGLANTQNVTTLPIISNTLYTLTVVDQVTSCQDTARLQLYVTGGPLAVSPLTTDDTVCNGTSVTLNANASGGGSTKDYTWTSNPVGFTSIASNPTLTPTQSAWYYVSVTDGANTANDSVYVHVWELPGITLASDVAICHGDSTLLSYNFTGASPFDFSITGAVTTTYNNQASPWSIYKKPTSTTTYTVNYLTDANGCTITPTGSTVVTVKSLPTITYTGNDTICLGDSALASAVFTGVAPFSYTYNGITVNNVNTFDHGIYMKPSLTTSYVVTNVTSDNGCSISGTLGSIEVAVNALPSFTHSGNDTICFGDSAAITMNFTGASPWAVTINNGSVSFTDNTSTSTMLRYAGPSATTEYKVINVVDGNGCAISGNLDSLEIFVNSLPVVNFTGLDAQYCSDAATSTLNPSPAGGTFTGSGINITSFNAGTAGVGNHTINYSYTDANGCSNDIDQSTIVYAAPVNVMPSLVSVCIGTTSFGLTATPTGGVWTGNGISGNNFNSSTAGAGNHYLKYSYTDSHGCSDLDSVLQVVNALPNVSFSGLASAYCSSASPATLSGNQFTAVQCTTSCTMPTTCTSTSSNYTYEYITNVTLNGASQTSTGSAYTDYTSSQFTQVGVGMTYALSGTIHADAGDYLVAFIDWNRDGSFGTDETYSVASGTSANASLAYSYNITVPSTAVLGETKMRISLNWNSAATSCQSFTYGEVEDYKLNVVGVQPGGTFTGSGITGTSFNPSTAGVGNHVITYTYTDGNGCTNSTTNSTQVNAIPTIGITGLASAYCTSASSATIVATPSGGTLSGNGIIGTSFSPSAAGAGSHYVKYAYTDANSCYNADSVAVTVNANPNIVMPTLAPVCILTANTTLSATPSGGTWTGNGVTGTSFNNTTAGVGSHYLVYSYTDANNCSDIDSAIQVVNALPVVSISSFDASYCTNGILDTLIGIPAGGIFLGNGITGVVFNPSTSGTGTIGITYLYQDANNCYNTAVASTNVYAFTQPDFTGLASAYCSNDAAATLTANPTGGVFSGNGVSGSTFDPSTSGSGNQTVTYTFTNSNNCVASQAYSTLVNSAPVVSFTGLDTAYCSNALGDTLVASPLGGSFSTNVQSNNYFDPSLVSVGSVSVVYSFTDANNCSNSATMNTTVNAAPVVALPALVELCADANTTLDAGSGLGYTYLWNTTDTTQTLVVDSIGYGLGTHPFSVTVSDLNGCQASGNSSVTFVEYPEINIPDTVLACGYNPIQVSAGTNTAFNYSWSFGANSATVSLDTTITGTGYFNVTVDVTNSTGCVASKAFVVKFNPIPVVNLGSDTSICKTHVLTLDAGAGFSYLWSTGATTQTLVVDSLNANLGINTFSVTVTLDGCSNTDAINVMVNPCTGIDNINGNFSMNIFPNPNSGKFTIKVEGAENDCIYNVYDMTGKLLVNGVLENVNYSNKVDLDFSNYPKGVYLVKVANGDSVKIERLIIQ